MPEDVVEVDDAAPLLQLFIVLVGRCTALDPGSGPSLSAARGRRIGIGRDSPRGGPIDFCEESWNTSTISGINRVSDEASSVGNDG